MALIEVGGLWKLKSGKEGFSGKLKESIDVGQRVAVLPNKYRNQNPKAPDWKIFLLTDREEAPKESIQDEETPF